MKAMGAVPYFCRKHRSTLLEIRAAATISAMIRAVFLFFIGKFPLSDSAAITVTLDFIRKKDKNPQNIYDKLRVFWKKQVVLLCRN